ncbi:hypothetical protein Btru_001600 [Bulinus truncatus]|nr:hypothetical protein Btru_001600 [Bulinus truncatus]
MSPLTNGEVGSSPDTETLDSTPSPPETGMKRNAPRNQNATPPCVADIDTPCVRERHPQCSVTYPESDGDNDDRCKIQVICRATCSARCFAIEQAFPSYGQDGPMFNFSVFTSNGSGRNLTQSQNWTNHLRFSALTNVTQFLDNQRRYRRFQINSSYVCSHIPPCNRTSASEIMDSTVIKIVTLVVLVVLTLISSVLPYFLVLRGSRSIVSARRQEQFIAYLNCFAGGVFLGTLLLHLLTEGSEVFEEYKNSINWHEEIPLFNIFVAVGFFLVAFVELFMRSYLFKEAPDAKLEIDVPNPSSARPNGNAQGQYGSLGTTVTNEHDHIHHECQISDQQNRIIPRSASDDMENAVNNNEDIVTLQVKVEIRSKTPTGIRAYLLLVALSFHTVFDGLAVGLQKEASEIWQIFAAIALHKTIIAFCLGLEVFKSQLHRPWRAFIWLCFFAMMSPIGIGIGILLTSGKIYEQARMLSSSILQGFASGIFLYVTFLELLCVYIGHNSKGDFFSIFYALVGFVVMAIVKLVDEA